MKVYDGTGWRVTDSISLANGTAAAPSLHFSSDTNTGLFRSAADSLAITTAGTPRVTVNSLGLINVTGGIQVTENVTPSAGSGIEIFKPSSTSGQIQAFNRSGNAWMDLILKGNTQQFYANGAPAMQIASSGNVGIGTSNPNDVGNFSKALDVSGASGASVLVRNNNSATNCGIFGYFGTSTYVMNRAAGPVLFYTSNTERMRIASSGKVGIGVLNPLVKLDVVDSAAMSAIFRQSSGNQTSVYIKHDDSSGRIGTSYAAGGGAYKALAFETSNTPRLTIDSSGRLLVGTSSTIGAGNDLVMLKGTSVADASIYCGRNANASSISNGNNLGFIKFGGGDGGVAASVGGVADGTWSSTSDCPGRLAFSTTADGASSPTERLRIDSSGNVNIIGTGTASAPKIALAASGSATFVGPVTVGSGVVYTRIYGGTMLVSNAGNAGQGFGVYNTTAGAYTIELDFDGSITAAGGIDVSRAGGTSHVFRGKTGSGSHTTTILANGTATFAGPLTVYDALAGSATDSSFTIRNPGNTADVASIDGNGSASFAGALDVGDNNGSSSGTGLYMQANGQAYLFTASAIDALNIYQGTNRNAFISSSGSATFASSVQVTSGLRMFRTAGDNSTRINIGESDTLAVWQNAGNFSIGYDGSASFAGGEVTINAAGNAAGKFNIDSTPDGGNSAWGLSVKNNDGRDGRPTLKLQNVGGGNAVEIKNSDASANTTVITTAGAATFAGATVSNGGFESSRTGGTSHVFRGRTGSGLFTTTILANGSASFASSITAAADSTINTLTIGRGAGNVSTNTAAGKSALNSNTSGEKNTASGYEALKANTTGDYNTANGYLSLLTNTTGNRNTGNGYLTLNYNSSGGFNTASGEEAMFNNTTGSYNTANGSKALKKNTTGTKNAADGSDALFNNTTGSYNTAVGCQALFNNTTGSGNIAIGGVNSSGSYVPVFNPTTESNRLVAGHTSITDAYVKVCWTCTSDERDKMNFAPVPYGLDFVNQLKPTAYQFKVDRDTETPNGDVRYGFKAQDILALEGDNPVIIDIEDPDNLKYKGEHLVPVLVNAVQELTAMVKDLQNEVAALRAG